MQLHGTSKLVTVTRDPQFNHGKMSAGLFSPQKHYKCCLCLNCCVMIVEKQFVCITEHDNSCSTHVSLRHVMTLITVAGITPKITNEVGMYVGNKVYEIAELPCNARLNAHRIKSIKDRHNKSDKTLIALPNDRAQSIGPSDRRQTHEWVSGTELTEIIAFSFIYQSLVILLPSLHRFLTTIFSVCIVSWTVWWHELVQICILNNVRF